MTFKFVYFGDFYTGIFMDEVQDALIDELSGDGCEAFKFGDNERLNSAWGLLSDLTNIHSCDVCVKGDNVKLTGVEPLPDEFMSQLEDYKVEIIFWIEIDNCVICDKEITAYELVCVRGLNGKYSRTHVVHAGCWVNYPYMGDN
jgi:hypothetical protein